MKKEQNLPNEKIQSNYNSGKPLPLNYRNSRSKSSYINNVCEQFPDRRNAHFHSQSRYSRSNSQNNRYSNNFLRTNCNEINYSNYDRNRSFFINRNLLIGSYNKRSRENSNNYRSRNNRSKTFITKSTPTINSLHFKLQSKDKFIRTY